MPSAAAVAVASDSNTDLDGICVVVTFEFRKSSHEKAENNPTRKRVLPIPFFTEANIEIFLSIIFIGIYLEGETKAHSNSPQRWQIGTNSGFRIHAFVTGKREKVLALDI